MNGPQTINLFESGIFSSSIFSLRGIVTSQFIRFHDVIKSLKDSKIMMMGMFLLAFYFFCQQNSIHAQIEPLPSQKTELQKLTDYKTFHNKNSNLSPLNSSSKNRERNDKRGNKDSQIKIPVSSMASGTTTSQILLEPLPPPNISSNISSPNRTDQVKNQESTPKNSLEPNKLMDQAIRFQTNRQWEQALEIYLQLMYQDKLNVFVRERIHLCLRHIFQQRRFRDSKFQEAVLGLTTSQAANFYEEVLNKIQAVYLDKLKVSPEKLFQASLKEFENALEDQVFRQFQLKNLSENQINSFRKLITDEWQTKKIKTVREAKNNALVFAKLASRQLGLQANFVFLEMVCGACNSLDEYSVYLNYQDLIVESSSSPLLPSVIDVRFIKEGVTYLKIREFRESTPQEFDTAIQSLKSSLKSSLKLSTDGDQIHSLIIDLRGNPGGNFAAAIQIAERFLPQGIVISTQGNHRDTNKVFSSSTGSNALDWGVIVLVDQQTASAAEVLAVALQDNHRAKIVGSPTFGKGLLQVIVPFETERINSAEGKVIYPLGAIRITLARIFSPNGQSLSIGISPNIVESNPQQQLEIAIEQASRFVPLTPMNPMPMNPMPMNPMPMNPMPMNPISLPNSAESVSPLNSSAPNTKLPFPQPINSRILPGILPDSPLPNPQS